MIATVMFWGEFGDSLFKPERIFWLKADPHPHWIETVKSGIKYEFKETGFRQFVDINSPYIITDAMLMFGIQHSYDTQGLIEALNPIRLTVRVSPGSYLGMSHHFLGAPFEIERDEILREYLNEARKKLEESGFGKDILVVCFDPQLEDNLLSNLSRIKDLNYRFLREA